MKQRRRIYYSAVQRSVILAVPGSADQTKTPTDCCASTFHVAPICPCIARPSLARSQGSSMKGRERPWLYQTPAEKFAECVAAIS